MNDPLSSTALRPANALISVVLPVYNEGQILPLLSARLSRTFLHGENNYEIIFVMMVRATKPPQYWINWLLAAGTSG